MEMNEQKTYNTIKVSIDTKMEFDQLQLDLKKKGVYRSQDQLVNMLMDTFKEHSRIMKNKKIQDNLGKNKN